MPPWKTRRRLVGWIRGQDGVETVETGYHNDGLFNNQGELGLLVL